MTNYVCQRCGKVHEDPEIEEGEVGRVQRDPYREAGVLEVRGETEYWTCENCGKRHYVSGVGLLDEEPKLRERYEKYKHRCL